MPALQVIALDTTTPRLRAPGSGDTYSAPRAVDITPESLTGSAATSSLSITQTWNTTGTPTALQLNLTDTASNAASLLMDLRVGGSSLFRVGKAGNAIAPLSSAATPAYAVGANATGLYSRSATLRLNFAVNGSDAGVEVGPGLFAFASTSQLAWVTSTLPGSSPDLFLARDAANTLAQRNGTNAQAFNIYNTYTDASNYERMSVYFSSNNAWIETQALGTGASRSLNINASAINLRTGGTARLTIDAAGTTSFAGNVSLPTGSQTLGWSGRSNLASSADGLLRVANAAGTDFGRLQFGGTTSSFPALKRNSTALETKLADDSAYAPHAMQYLDIDDGMTAPASATGRARIYVDSADGDLKVVFADGTVKTIVTDT